MNHWALLLLVLQVTNRELHALLRFVDSDYSNCIDTEEFSKLLLGKSIFSTPPVSTRGPDDPEAIFVEIAKTPLQRAASYLGFTRTISVSSH